jgi:hypothetical protein
MMFRRTVIAASVSIALASAALSALAGTETGPTSSETPYVVNVPPSVHIISLITVGDSVNDKPDSATPYRMVGIPDGMGAFDNNDGTFTVLMNHEVADTRGVPRQHGLAGAFVSHWIVRKSDLAVLHGGDQMKQVLAWGGAGFVPNTRALNRLCSANLPSVSALYNGRTGKGYTGRIFMNGEESGTEGRAFAHIVTGPGAGISYELPSLGKFAWENSVASPYEQDKTVVVGTDDGQGGQVYVYVGTKLDKGNEIEKAGLHGGQLYGIKVAGVPAEPRADGILSADFSLHPLGDVTAKTGVQLDADSDLGGVTHFLRPEDGAWDTRNPSVFYFVTTDRYDSVKDTTGTPANQVGRSRLYRLTFSDIRDPEAGGRIDMLLNGTEAQQMLDNITVDGDGNLLMQEDPGGQQRLAKIWKFDPRSRSLVEVARHDPERFMPGGAKFKTIDEESSGVIEITSLLSKHPSDRGRFGWEERERDAEEGDEADERFRWAKRGYRYYLSVTQVHLANPDAELVEGGQLYFIAVPRNLR